MPVVAEPRKFFLKKNSTISVIKRLVFLVFLNLSFDEALKIEFLSKMTNCHLVKRLLERMPSRVTGRKDPGLAKSTE